MLEFSLTNYNKIKEYVDISLTDKYSELEVVIKPDIRTKIFSKDDFERVFERLKYENYEFQESMEELNINFIDKKFKDVRLSILGIANIQEYCNTNQISKIDDKFITIIYKNRYRKDKQYLKPLYFNDYNFNLNINIEKECHEKDKNELKKRLSNMKKYYRLKKRYTFITEDKLFRYDLTIIRSATVDNRTGDYIYYRDLESSKTLTNPDSYEFEIEFIGFDRFQKITAKEVKNVTDNLIDNIGILLQPIRNTYYLISNSERIRVLKEYGRLVTGKELQNKDLYQKSLFIGPKNVSLEKKDMMPIQTDFIGYNIRMDYCVTDKADGERFLLFISKNHKLYLINNRLEVFYTGCKSNYYSGSILDGELIRKDKKGGLLFLYMIFDVYFSSGEDVRIRQLMRSDKDKQKNVPESRLEILETILNKTIIQYENTQNNEENSGSHSISSSLEEGEVKEEELGTELKFKWKLKEFYYGDIGVVGTKIFQQSKFLLDKIESGGFQYETDGLIYTPVKLPVGGYVEGVVPNNTGVMWNVCFKWKPSQDNTIDFLVNVMKEKTEEGKYIDKISYQYDEKTGEMKKYKTLILKTGYNPNIYDKVDICMSLYTNDTKHIGKKKRYIAKEFIPNNPYIEESYLADIEVVMDSQGNEKMICYKTGDEIEDNSIVEMSYDVSIKEVKQRWKPRNVRYDKTMERRLGYTQYGNDYATAESIWYSYYYPITINMITTGEGITQEDILADEDKYYSRVIKRDKSYTKSLLDFHNSFVKFKLIKSVSQLVGDEGRLLDLACGKAGDLHKWIQSNLKLVLGIDISVDNIENPNDGACMRYYDTRELYKKRRQLEKVPEMLFMAGNTSKSISDGDCSSIPKYKELLQIIFGNQEIDKDKVNRNLLKLWNLGESGFDITSIQFALHYYFKDIDTLRGILNNVSKHTRVGGYFIGTCFDGKLIFDKLKDTPKGDYIQGELNGVRIWRIKKDYDINRLDDDESSLGQGIWVYMETINQMIKEYLVNFDYLTVLMRDEYGFELVEDDRLTELNLKPTGLFKDLFNVMMEDDLEYKDAKKMTNKEKEISFMNRYFIFKKVKNV